MIERTITCRGIAKNGQRCRVPFALSDDGYCCSHDPLRAVEFALARRKGGVAAGERKRVLRAILPPGLPRAPKSLDDCVRMASWNAHAVASGIIDGRTSHEISFALNCFRGALEKSDLLREIEKLRADLAAARKAPALVKAN